MTATLTATANIRAGSERPAAGDCCPDGVRLPGASAFVLKSAPIQDLIAAIRKAAAGGLSFGLLPGQPVALTARELDVVRLVVEGGSNDEIGLKLGIAPRTVETHLRRVFERLGVASRTELATRALREGWMELPVDGV